MKKNYICKKIKNKEIKFDFIRCEKKVCLRIYKHMDSWKYMHKKFEVTKVECAWHWGVRDKIRKVKFCIICECHTVFYNKKYALYWASLVAQLVKNPLAMQETPPQFPGREDPLEKG